MVMDIVGTILILVGLGSLMAFFGFIIGDKLVQGWLSFCVFALCAMFVGIIWTTGNPPQPHEPPVHYQHKGYCVSVDSQGETLCFDTYPRLRKFLDQNYGR